MSAYLEEVLTAAVFDEKNALVTTPTDLLISKGLVIDKEVELLRKFSVLFPSGKSKESRVMKQGATGKIVGNVENVLVVRFETEIKGKKATADAQIPFDQVALSDPTTTAPTDTAKAKPASAPKGYEYLANATTVKLQVISGSPLRPALCNTYSPAAKISVGTGWGSPAGGRDAMRDGWLE